MKSNRQLILMNFSQFIESEMENILREWDAFAETLFTGSPAGSAYLFRDHAREMLLEISRDMRTLQTDQQQIAKSKGRMLAFHPDESAANVHGMARHDDGLTIGNLAAEFRALRASVLRLWLPKIPVMSKEAVIDIIRFNESIDEALADSITTFCAAS